METPPTTCQPTECAKPIFVARQPILDREQGIWGFELFFRASSKAVKAEIQDPDLATATVIVDGFPMASAGVKPEHRLAINFTRNMVINELYASLPGGRCVADLPSQHNDPQFLEACKKLQKLGFLLATEVPAKSELVKLVDIIRIDVTRFEMKSLINSAQQLQKMNCLKLAQRVEDDAIFQLLLDLKFDLFQGYLFSKPQTLPGSAPNLSKIAKLRILRELYDEDFSNAEVTKIISSDVGLSYRLIRFINSPYFGFNKKINTISHAISLLGQQPLRQWLMAITLSQISEGSHGREIYFSCIKRARFLELLTEKIQKGTVNGQELFLLGLFSRLDELLSQPMEQLVGELNLGDDIGKALCGEQNLYKQFLDITSGIEQAQWSELGPQIRSLGLKAADVAICHNMAVLWAAEISETNETDAADQTDDNG